MGATTVKVKKLKSEELKDIVTTVRKSLAIEAEVLGEHWRECGGIKVCLFVKPKKVGKLINRLPNQGFAGFCFLDEERQIKWFGEEE